MKNSQTFKNSLSQIPGVGNISISENIPSGVGSYWGGTFTNGYEYMFAKIRVDTSFMGIFGLVTFMLNRRTKEMGIRKVLGASYPDLFSLLSREFIKLVIIANVIGLPAAWYFISKWLENFPNRVAVSWWMFLVSVVLLVLLSVITILIKSNQVFRSSTVEALKYE